MTSWMKWMTLHQIFKMAAAPARHFCTQLCMLSAIHRRTLLKILVISSWMLCFMVSVVRGLFPPQKKRSLEVSSLAIEGAAGSVKLF